MLLRYDPWVHFRNPAISRVERGAWDLDAVGLLREGLPCGDPLDKWFDTAQGCTEDRRRKLSIAPYSYSNIVIWGGGVSWFGWSRFEDACLHVTSEVFATVIMESNRSIVIRQTLYWMSVFCSDTQPFV